MKSSTAEELVTSDSARLVAKEVRCGQCGKLLCRIRYHFSSSIPSVLSLQGLGMSVEAKVSVETKCPRCKQEDYNITVV